jgi:hypothetical protein
MDDDLELLIARYLDGTASPEEVRSLDLRLKDDAGARRRFFVASAQEVQVRELLGQVRGDAAQGAPTEPGPRESRRTGSTRIALLRRRAAAAPSGFGRAALIAAGALVGLTVLMSLFRSGPDAPLRKHGAPAEGRPLPEEARHGERPPIAQEESEPLAVPPRRDERKKEEIDPELNEQKARLPKIREEGEEKRTLPPSNPSTLPGTLPAAPTRISLARVGRLEGEVWALEGGRRFRVQLSHEILAGHGLETVGPASRAGVEFPDGTRLELGADTTLGELCEDGGKNGVGRRIVLARGALKAEVARQPSGRSMAIGTPHGEARVLGTTLRISVDGVSTRLEVTEGRVRLTRKLDGRSVDVAAGHYAVAAAGTELAPKRLPIDEILIVAKLGEIVGSDWTYVKDTNASSGGALQSLRGSRGFDEKGPSKVRSYVLFKFEADADRDYTVWVRGWCLRDREGVGSDSVVLEVPEGRFQPRCPYYGRGREDIYTLQDFFLQAGYWWCGGRFAWEQNRPPQDPWRSFEPVTVRFSRRGWHVLKLYSREGPMRVDALWLSTAQKALPEVRHPGPFGKPK